MTDDDAPRIVSASRDVAADHATIFDLIAEPTEQPRWDGNDNLVEAPEGQRVRAVGDRFRMTTTKGNVRENHVVEFEEGRLIAWTPAEVDREPFGHLWRWELDPLFLPLVLLGPVVSGAVVAARDVDYRWIATLWASAGVNMAWTDWVVNREDVAFHLALAVVMPLLAGVGFGVVSLARRTRRTA